MPSGQGDGVRARGERARQVVLDRLAAGDVHRHQRRAVGFGEAVVELLRVGDIAALLREKSGDIRDKARISGPPTYGQPGAARFGTMLSGSLEQSNVDIAEEMVGLITAQRYFQANAKAIDTATQLSQTIINLRT